MPAILLAMGKWFLSNPWRAITWLLVAGILGLWFLYIPVIKLERDHAKNRLEKATDDLAKAAEVVKEWEAASKRCSDATLAYQQQANAAKANAAKALDAARKANASRDAEIARITALLNAPHKPDATCNDAWDAIEGVMK